MTREKQCHILLSKISKKNRVEITSWAEKKNDRLLICTKCNRPEAIWLVNFLYFWPCYFNYTEGSSYSLYFFNFSELVHSLLDIRINKNKWDFQKQCEGELFWFTFYLLLYRSYTASSENRLRSCNLCGLVLNLHKTIDVLEQVKKINKI